MYELADALDPDSLRELATACFAEMALAGITTVGEFHYVHHGRGGAPYSDPNAMGRALIDAAGRGAPADAARRLLPPRRHRRRAGGAQRRFADADADAWAARVTALADEPARPDRRGDPQRPGRRPRVGRRRGRLGERRRAAAARARLRATGRGRGVPRGLRLHSGGGAGRRRRPERALHGGPRDAPRGRRLRPAWRRGGDVLPLPDHRARPGRRHRARAAPHRCRRPARRSGPTRTR